MIRIERARVTFKNFGMDDRRAASISRRALELLALEPRRCFEGAVTAGEDARLAHQIATAIQQQLPRTSREE